MKIKVVNVYKLTKPVRNIVDVKIIEGDFITKDKKFINSDENLEFTIESVGLVNPPTNNYYPLIVNVNDNVDISMFKDKLFVGLD